MASRAMILDRVGAVKQRMKSLDVDGQVRLMAVTKHRTHDEALWAVEGGADLVGENRVQEAVAKWSEQKPPVPLHMIGHLQTNKVKYGIRLFDSFDSVDSDRVAETLEQRVHEPTSILVEVNIAGESTKSGLAPDAVLPFLAGARRWSHLRVMGLMAILPARRENSAEESRRIRHDMQEMVDLWRMCRSEGYPWAPMTELSMGMTGDWEWAMEAGTTMIRLGTYLFGPRPTQ